jgi:hypothetical protein
VGTPVEVRVVERRLGSVAKVAVRERELHEVPERPIDRVSRQVEA